jgi:hypothetical protein
LLTLLWMLRRLPPLLLHPLHLPSRSSLEFPLLRPSSRNDVDHYTCCPCVLVEFPPSPLISSREDLLFSCSPLSASTLPRDRPCLQPSRNSHSRVLHAFHPPSWVMLSLDSRMTSRAYVLDMWPFSLTWTPCLRLHTTALSPSRVDIMACVAPQLSPSFRVVISYPTSQPTKARSTT